MPTLLNKNVMTKRESLECFRDSTTKKHSSKCIMEMKSLENIPFHLSSTYTFVCKPLADYRKIKVTFVLSINPK